MEAEAIGGGGRGGRRMKVRGRGGTGVLKWKEVKGGGGLVMTWGRGRGIRTGMNRIVVKGERRRKVMYIVWS